MSRRSAYALGSGALLVAALAWIFLLLREPSTAYITVPVERGLIEATVTAMGTLNPVKTVEVGTYVSGRIERIDVDFNSRVSKGQVIAKIDPANYKGKVQQARSMPTVSLPADSRIPPICMFSRTVSDGNTLSTCGTYAIPRATSLSVRHPETSVSS